MRVAVLTSSLHGTAAHHLPKLAASGCCEVVMVIHAQAVTINRKRSLLRKLRKMLSIGIAGALNGIRMRKWFHVPTEDLRDVCGRLGIPLKSVPGINSPGCEALLKELGVDLGLSLGNGYIARRIFSLPTLGMLNIHHEELPAYQNAQSVIWQIHNGSRHTGYTIHQIEQKIDTGAILHQQRIPIVFKNDLAHTVNATYSALLDASAEGLVHVMCHFEELRKLAKPQGGGTRYTTPRWSQFKRIRRNHDLLKRG